jgi:hypothetical protein
MFNNIYYINMPSKKITHKRGGIFTLRIMNDVTNWNGVSLDIEILNFLKKDDSVRVIFEENEKCYYGTSRYITITDVLPDGYFKGYIDDPYDRDVCYICDKESEKHNYLYHCNCVHCINEWNINKYHKKCFESHMKKHPDDNTCYCNQKKVLYQKYETIIFKKNNISEIPNWSKNTYKLIEQYKNKDNKGYAFTGFR